MTLVEMTLLNECLYHWYIRAIHFLVVRRFLFSPLFQNRMTVFQD